MAASKKGNKTAHVLNLLTAPGAPKEGGGDGAAEGSVPESAVTSSRPLLPPILEVAQANDADLSQQIQQALEEELSDSAAPEPPQSPKTTLEEVPPMATEQPVMDQAPQSAPAAPSGGKMSQEDIEKLLAASAAPAPEPEPAPAPAPSGGKMSQEDIEKLLAGANASAPEPEPAPAPAPAGGKMSQEDIEKLLAGANASAPAPELSPESKTTPPPTPTPPPAPVKKEEEEDVSYTNIMEVLVEEKAPRYIKKFGLCSCKQCVADVKALTLTNLVPKYVVLSKLDRIPMLTVYEGRFNTTIFAQLTRACKVVMDHPHHNRQ